MSLTNGSDFAGSLLYNLSILTGSTPDVDDMVKYSDVVYNVNTYKDYVTLQPTSLDGTATNMISYSYTMYVYPSDESVYERGDWFLLGQKWLPLFPPPQANGQYQIRKRIDGQVFYNKARSDVLIPTAITIAKVAGIAVGGYYALKYGYKLARKEA